MFLSPAQPLAVIESKAARDLYGVDDENKLKAGFARNCLPARRLIERGVRFARLFDV